MDKDRSGGMPGSDHRSRGQVKNFERTSTDFSVGIIRDSAMMEGKDGADSDFRQVFSGDAQPERGG